MEVMQLRVQGKRLHCGSLRALLTGRAALTTGSMSRNWPPLVAAHDFQSALVDFVKFWFQFKSGVG